MVWMKYEQREDFQRRLDGIGVNGAHNRDVMRSVTGLWAGVTKRPVVLGEAIDDCVRDGVIGMGAYEYICNELKAYNGRVNHEVSLVAHYD